MTWRRKPKKSAARVIQEIKEVAHLDSPKPEPVPQLPGAFERPLAHVSAGVTPVPRLSAPPLVDKTDRLEVIEARLEELAQQLRGIEARVERLREFTVESPHEGGTVRVYVLGTRQKGYLVTVRRFSRYVGDKRVAGYEHDPRSVLNGTRLHVVGVHEREAVLLWLGSLGMVTASGIQGLVNEHHEDANFHPATIINLLRTRRIRLPRPAEDR